jgi:hypothetical protein
MTNKNDGVIRKISCRHYTPSTGSLGPNTCNAEECIYDDQFQYKFNGSAGCKVYGIVNPSQIPEDKRSKLSEEDLKEGIEQRITERIS